MKTVKKDTVKVYTREEYQTWRENCVCDMLRRGGYLIVDSQSRPDAKHPSAVLDIVAWCEATDTMVAIAVGGSDSLLKHGDNNAFQRLRNSTTRRRYLRLYNAWRRLNKWHGDYAIASATVYGMPDKWPVIDLCVHKSYKGRDSRKEVK